MPTLTLDYTRPAGKVKPMHGVNNAPIGSYHNYDKFHYLTEAGIPYCRLHDFGGSFGGAHFVDVENIFPNMDADENDPASYDFAITDLLITELKKAGVEPFYRLGATIENGHWIKAYHINPPKDNEKYARVCANIIRHYNEGWADGFHYGIEYWEIWNEPDNTPEIKDNPCWKGTKEQFFELYRTVANHLRREFPNIKIGGYASCGFYAVMKDKVADEVIKRANVSPRFQNFIVFFDDFLKYITAPETSAPLDFFSWHTYASARDNRYHADYAREQLDKYGLTETESILNEWNPDYTLHGNTQHAVATAQNMLALHDRLDQMEFYTADCHGGYGSLFDATSSQPTKSYYVFKAFNELYKLGGAVKVSTDSESVFALGATDGNTRALMLASDAPEELRLALDGTAFAGKNVTARLIDETRTYEQIECDPASGSIRVPANSVMLITAE